ncbi:MAG: hypothetical protein AAGE89_13750 [Pseudomonadota bacterium]
MKPTGLLSQASWSLTGQIGFYGFQWLNMILLARLSGPEAVGLYTLALAIATPIMAVASLMLRLVYVTERSERWSFGIFNKVRLFALPTGALAIIATGWMLGYRDLPLIVIMIAASWKMAESMSDISYSVPHKSGEMRTIALSMIARAGISSIVLGMVLYSTERLDLSLIAFSAVWWACFLFYDRSLSPIEPAADRYGRVSGLIRFAAPMALSAAIVYATFSVPRIVLDQYETTAALGVFAAISHLLLIGMLALNSLGAAITPRVAKYFAEHNFIAFYREIAFCVAIACFLSLAFIAVAWFAGDLIVTWIYGPGLSGYDSLVFAIALASLPLYVGSLIGFVPPALQAFRFHLLVNILTVTGTALTAFYFVPTHGILGAVYAIGVQGLLQLLNALVLFKKPAPLSGSKTGEKADLALGSAKA